jgi:hypothetical protein
MKSQALIISLSPDLWSLLPAGFSTLGLQASGNQWLKGNRFGNRIHRLKAGGKRRAG